MAALTAASDPPIVDDDEFSKILAELLADAVTRHPRTTMVLCSLPILGEDLSSELNQRRIERKPHHVSGVTDPSQYALVRYRVSIGGFGEKWEGYFTISSHLSRTTGNGRQDSGN